MLTLLLDWDPQKNKPLKDAKIPMTITIGTKKYSFNGVVFFDGGHYTTEIKAPPSIV